MTDADMTSPNPDVVATLEHIGPRDTQQDRAIGHLNSDGSWVVAVFDGLGGHDRGDEAAQAAADALPARIDGRAEMHAAVRSANAAVWGLVPEPEHVPRRLGLHRNWPATFEPLKTLAAAAWTPQNGLRTAWLGDSVLFFVPIPADMPGMHSEPQGSWDSPIMNNALGFTKDDAESSIGSMPDNALEELGNHIAGDGLLVVAAADGLFDPIRVSRYGPGGRFSDDPLCNSVGFAVPAPERSNATAAAATLMHAAHRLGLTDNAAVAVARG